MSAPFNVYATGGGVARAPVTSDAPYDEMFAQGEIRPGYDLVGRQFERIGTEDLLRRAEALSSAYIEQGVTFDIGGVERPFPLDIMPRLIEPEVWSPVEKGVAQRVRALERFLDDVYGEGAAFGDGVIPRQVVLSFPALPPRRPRVEAPGRRPGPRGGDRPHPRQRRCLLRPRGQRPGPVRGVLR